MSDTPIPEAPTPDQGIAENQHTAAPAAGKPATDPTSEAAASIVPDSGGTTAAADDPRPSAVRAPEEEISSARSPGSGDATGSGTQSTAVLTKTPPEPATPAAPPVSVSFAQLLSAPPGTADLRTAAWPSPPPPIPPVPPRWQRVARPPGVLPAAALAGIVGASVIPLDRPGIGWLIAGSAIAGALCVVDYRARTRGTSAERSSDSAPPSPTPSTPTPSTPAPSTPAPAAADSTGTNAAEPLPRSAPGAVAAPDADDVAAVTGRSESARAADTGTSDSAAPAHAAASDAVVPSAEALSAAAAAPGNAAADRVNPASSAAKTADPVEAGEIASPAVSIGDRAWWAAAAIVLLGVGTVRAAGWLFVLCVLAACVAGSLAVLGRRSVRGIAHDMFAVPLASFGAVPWAFSGLRESRSVGTSSVRRYGISVAATAALLVVFVPLLGGADATFAKLLNGLVPTVDGPAIWQWIFLFAIVTVSVLGALYLLAGPPSRATDSVRPQRLWSRSEWMLPVGALTVLFAVFVGAQFVALFGGDDYVQRTAGLTYAEYARSGFWQLSAVSILTLAVILAVLHWSVRETAADRRSLRILLSAVSVLALVIVCSALGRMWTYQQAYGFTVLRLLVTTCELWVGLVYVLVLVAIARLRWSWVPRAAIGTALGTLIAVAVLNPEHLVAERNIDRWHTSGRLDADYLSSLSPDILAALDPLPTHLRTQIETPILDDLDNDHWWSWNWSRSSAR
ncbi:DUF4153 domain-containing protein [Nocardia sp. NPDC060249]|uniref:DUF4153 domain-containing protein n=1 Tax=Nocardia sp. NPDC060249 TaxID=3347082 RepID=UPI00365348AB